VLEWLRSVLTVCIFTDAEGKYIPCRNDPIVHDCHHADNCHNKSIGYRNVEQAKSKRQKKEK
jgi:hypothetical protein